ncbi:hypothetical protein GCM10027189_10950 [Rufibacter soli]
MVVAAKPLDLKSEVATWSICSLRDNGVLDIEIRFIFKTTHVNAGGQLNFIWCALTGQIEGALEKAIFAFSA